MIIEAAVARAVKAPLSFEKLDLDEPRPDEILVRLVATGVCHTDIAMRDQTFPVPQPIVLGHEGAGVVAKIGASVTVVKPGDRVVMSYDSCGLCPSCSDRAPTYCYEFFGRNFAGIRGDGSTSLRSGNASVHGNFFGQSSFATYALCRERNVVPVTADVPLELLGPLACGIQTGAGAVMNSFALPAGRSLAVFGAGSVGLSAIMAARVCGARTIVAVDLHPARLDLAREVGATHVIDATNERAAPAIVAMTGGGVDFALEATGIPAVIREAVESLAPRGVCGIVGAGAVGSEVSLDVLHIMTAGRTLRGIVEGDADSKTFIPKLIELYRAGSFPFDRLVRSYPFAELNTAIADSENGRVVKAVVTM